MIQLHQYKSTPCNRMIKPSRHCDQTIKDPRVSVFALFLMILCSSCQVPTLVSKSFDIPDYLKVPTKIYQSFVNVPTDRCEPASGIYFQSGCHILTAPFHNGTRFIFWNEEEMQTYQSITNGGAISEISVGPRRLFDFPLYRKSIESVTPFCIRVNRWLRDRFGHVELYDTTYLRPFGSYLFADQHQSRSQNRNQSQNQTTEEGCYQFSDSDFDQYELRSKQLALTYYSDSTANRRFVLAFKMIPKSDTEKAGSSVLLKPDPFRTELIAEFGTSNDLSSY